MDARIERYDPAESAAPGQVVVDDHPTDVGIGVLQDADVLPAFERPDEDVLHETVDLLCGTNGALRLVSPGRDAGRYGAPSPRPSRKVRQ